ncbi:hypothetical protein [uncultured Pseudomonas sp.]|uniref:hypothetical protein n=1 Tax=uncultured Pseudomonas sp. TaxID=114707 RepID=UPI0025EB32A6|nr:hypothetical protein [uncultured Pseudomonas sp.]
MKQLTELMRANAQAQIDRAVVSQERMLTHIVETERANIGDELKRSLIVSYEASYQAMQQVIDSNQEILIKTRPEA